jgi:hypothetical protein
VHYWNANLVTFSRKVIEIEMNASMSHFEASISHFELSISTSTPRSRDGCFHVPLPSLDLPLRALHLDFDASISR